MVKEKGFTVTDPVIREGAKKRKRARSKEISGVYQKHLSFQGRWKKKGRQKWAKRSKNKNPGIEGEKTASQFIKKLKTLRVKKKETNHHWEKT